MSSSTAVVSDVVAAVAAKQHQDKAAIDGIHGTPTGWKHTWVQRIALRAGVASLSTAAAKFLHKEHLDDIKALTHGAAALRTIGAHKTNRVTAKHVRAYLRMKNRAILGGPVLVSASAKAAAKKSREDKPFKFVTEGGVTYVSLSYFVAGAPGTYDALNYGSFAKTDTYSDMGCTRILLLRRTRSSVSFLCARSSRCPTMRLRHSVCLVFTRRRRSATHRSSA